MVGGYDELPGDVRERFKEALVRILERDELMRALGAAIDGMLREADDVWELAAKVEPELSKLVAA
jgi:hypothetical protein